MLKLQKLEAQKSWKHEKVGSMKKLEVQKLEIQNVETTIVGSSKSWN